MIVGLDHIQLAMPPGEESAIRDFCTGLLKLAEIEKPETLKPRGGVWFSLADGREVHYGVEKEFQPNRKAHPAFAVEELDALAIRLTEAKFSVTWDDALLPRRRFYSRDPFGNRLEFMEAQR
jgi:hypothetical protein